MVSGELIVGGSSLAGEVEGDGFSGCCGWCSKGGDDGDVDDDDDGFSGCSCGVGGDGVSLSAPGLLGVRL